jgi:hypothetical protein
VRRASPLLASVALAGALVACGATRGHVDALVPRDPALGVQRLRPGVSARACRSTLLGITVAGEAAPLDQALRRLLEKDPQATVLADVDLEWSWLSTGLYNRTCVAVRADAARVVPTVLLPGAHH